MRVFVAGASGAIGRPLVRQLVAAGHEVTGTTRSEERAAEIRAAGGEAAVVDVYDAPALEQAARAASPEAVVHLLTALPAAIQAEDELPGGDQPGPHRGDAQPARGGPRGGRPPRGRRERRLSLRPGGGLGQERGGALNLAASGHFGEAMRALADLERAGR